MSAEVPFKIRIGRLPNNDFKIMFGDEDVTDKFSVKSLNLALDSSSGPTTVELECYVDEIELLPEHVRIQVVDERRRGKLRQDESGHWYAVPESELEEFDRREAVLAGMNGGEENWDDLCESFTDLFGRYRLNGGPQDVEVVLP